MGLRRFGGPGMHGIGGVPLSSLGGAVHGGYFTKVLATGPIAYWPLWEASGTVARCLVNTAQNGTYNSDVSTWPPGTGIGDGNTAPYFDGANDCINIQTAAFTAAFNGSTGSVMIWIKAGAAGVWTDGTNRYHFRLSVDGNNLVYQYKTNVNNIVNPGYGAGAVFESRTQNTAGALTWLQFVTTWDKPSDAVMYYYNGAWQETDNTLGVWAGALTASAIGASNIVPTSVWQGWLAHMALWSRPLTAPEIASLAVV